jgi:magnesium-transporting ATPase (P-type)
MEHKQNPIIAFLSQTMILFAVIILILVLLASLFGDGAQELSSLYQLGSKGLATSTILQFLLSSAVIITLKNFFFSEIIFKKLLSLWRTVLSLFSILIANIIFIVIFDWFTLKNAAAWAGFLICFGGGCILGSLFMIIKTKIENKQYDNLLNSYKRKQERKREDE